MEQQESNEHNRSKTLKLFLLALAFGLVVIWLINTPPGLLGKTDAIAYAICHRIGSHSFTLGTRPFSLCARCTGEYLGFLWGFFFQLVIANRRFKFPPKKTLIPLGILALLFLFDGLNSFLHLYPGLEEFSLYHPQNSLRLASGLGMGLFISVILYPLMGQTVFTLEKNEITISNVSDWLIFFSGGIILGVLVLVENPLLSYPLIILSTFGLVILLTALYTVIWVLIMKRENSFERWSELTWWILGGFTSAIVQIALVDLIRFLVTGTWSGFLDY